MRHASPLHRPDEPDREPLETLRDHPFVDYAYVAWGLLLAVVLAARSHDEFKLAAGAGFILTGLMRLYHRRRMRWFFRLLAVTGASLPVAAWTALPLFCGRHYDADDVAQLVGVALFPALVLVLLALAGLRSTARPMARREDPAWTRFASEWIEASAWLTFGVLAYGEWNALSVTAVFAGTALTATFFFALLPFRLPVTAFGTGLTLVTVGVNAALSIAFLMYMNGPRVREAALGYLPAALLVLAGCLAMTAGARPGPEPGPRAPGSSAEAPDDNP